jgi:hypothetical protein
MDATRDMVGSWTDLPEAFPYSEKFITGEPLSGAVYSNLHQERSL